MLKTLAWPYHFNKREIIRTIKLMEKKTVDIKFSARVAFLDFSFIDNYVI